MERVRRVLRLEDTQILREVVVRLPVQLQQKLVYQGVYLRAHPEAVRLVPELHGVALPLRRTADLSSCHSPESARPFSSFLLFRRRENRGSRFFWVDCHGVVFTSYELTRRVTYV